MQVQDEGSGGTILDCIMGISPDTVVIVEEISRQIVLVLPTNTLLGTFFIYLLVIVLIYILVFQ